LVSPRSGKNTFAGLVIRTSRSWITSVSSVPFIVGMPASWRQSFHGKSRLLLTGVLSPHLAIQTGPGGEIHR
jgi:hypothetical protein